MYEFELQLTSHFAAAMALSKYQGPCANLHGHTYAVDVVVATKTLDQYDMIIDHVTLKQYLDQVLQKFDHKYLNDLVWFADTAPTTENIARMIFEQMTDLLKQYKNINVKQVKIAENQNVSISYGR
jgi:6-pyruvoyltetrahydropterin/6-carboxytetrahydropterin synthase|tara:strand:- start:3534 stop:3911 length:378 start_codon:yes stop_codon:yes gene_type:complete